MLVYNKFCAYAQHPYACALLIGRSLATIRFALVCSCGVCKSKLLRRHSPVFAQARHVIRAVQVLNILMPALCSLGEVSPQFALRRYKKRRGFPLQHDLKNNMKKLIYIRYTPYRMRTRHNSAFYTSSLPSNV